MRETQAIPRGYEFALFATGMIWAVAAAVIAGKGAQGLVVRFGLESGAGLLTALFLVFLLVIGFQLLDWIATKSAHADEALSLPGRAGWRAEWGLGAAVGWGLALAAVVPLLLSRNLHTHLRMTGAGWISTGLAVLTLAAITLAEEVIARGYAFQRLVGAIGPSWAAVFTSAGFAVALVWGSPPLHLPTALLTGFLLGLILAMAALRTKGLWVSWGLHFAYRAVMAVVVGLPIVGRNEFSSVVDTFATGPRWLTGGAFGVDAAWWTVPVLVAGFVVVFRATKEYAWAYTYRPIVAAGYEVTVAPPAAHTAMEKQAAAAAPPLVQILGSTPQTRSVVGPAVSGEFPKD